MQKQKIITFRNTASPMNNNPIKQRNSKMHQVQDHFITDENISKLISDLRNENADLLYQLEFKNSQNNVQELLIKSGFSDNDQAKISLE